MITEGVQGASLVLDNSARYWAGEFEIAIRYFTPGSRLRTMDGDLRWLRHQMFKEWTGSGVYGPRSINVMTLVSDAHDKMQRADPLADLAVLDGVCDQLEFAADELRHYVLLARLHHAAVGPTALSLHDMGELREGCALTELRYQLRATRAGQMAVDLSEGGGLGLYFGIQRVLGPVATKPAGDAMLCDAVDRIVDDERGHLLYNFQRAAAGDYSADDWAQIDARLREISRQKLRERNEQFGDVLSDTELSSIDRGDNAWRPFADHYLQFIRDALTAGAAQHRTAD